MKYSIEGEMLLKQEKRKFHKEVESDSQKRALELVYQTLGSNHGLRRKEVKITSVQEVK
jgi:ribosomal protein L20A (L18A)